MTERAKVALGKAGPTTLIHEKYSVIKKKTTSIFFFLFSDFHYYK